RWRRWWRRERRPFACRRRRPCAAIWQGRVVAGGLGLVLCLGRLRGQLSEYRRIMPRIAVCPVARVAASIALEPAHMLRCQTMLKSTNRTKLIHAIVYFATHTRFCGKVKLFKLLYLLDF